MLEFMEISGLAEKTPPFEPIRLRPSHPHIE